MLIRIHRTGGYRVDERDNLRALKVRAARGMTADHLAAALGRDGRADPDGAAVWLRIDALRAAAGGATAQPAWLAEFEAMICFARRNGWVDEAGTVRAHIDWTEPEDDTDDDQI